MLKKKKKKKKLILKNDEKIQNEYEKKSPWAEQNIVSPNNFKQTRSGRNSVKPLPFWANYRLLNGEIHGSKITFV